MEQSVFVFLLFSGLTTLNSCPCHRYHFVNATKTWTEAQSFCRENYTDLATIYSHNDMGRLKNATEGQWPNYAWIGLHRPTEWQWSQPKRGLNNLADYLKENQPSHANGSEDCATMRDHQFLDFSCSHLAYFICYNGSTDTYTPISEKKTWHEAECYCRNKHTDLISVRNDTEYESIRTKLKELGATTDWWIGLSRNWRWSDGSKYSLDTTKNSIQGNEPQQQKNCFAVKSSESKWEMQNCNTEHPFFCYEDGLVLVSENKTWDEALDYCRENHDDLVSVTTETLQHWVKRRALKASSDHVWLGLRFSCTLQFWHWVDGDVLCHHNWAPGKEADECRHSGAVQSSGLQEWVSLPKNETLNFICSKLEPE